MFMGGGGWIFFFLKRFRRLRFFTLRFFEVKLTLFEMSNAAFWHLTFDIFWIIFDVIWSLFEVNLKWAWDISVSIWILPIQIESQALNFSWLSIDLQGFGVQREPGFWGFGVQRERGLVGFGVQRAPVGGCGWEELGFGPINSGTRFHANLGSGVGFGVQREPGRFGVLGFSASPLVGVVGKNWVLAR